jgi:benzoylformate decarboxylase
MQRSVAIKRSSQSLPPGKFCVRFPMVFRWWMKHLAPTFSRRRCTGRREGANISTIEGERWVWGMPAAIGVSLARDHAPVLCMVGDGSAMYSPQALWSAVHEEVPVVFVVLNNLEYGILKNFMLSQPQYNAKEHGFLAMDICQPKVDFQSLARSMGVESTFVDSHRKISEAVAAALNTGKPHLIEIAVTGVAGK